MAGRFTDALYAAGLVTRSDWMGWGAEVAQHGTRMPTIDDVTLRLTRLVGDVVCCSDRAIGAGGGDTVSVTFHLVLVGVSPRICRYISSDVWPSPVR